MPGLQGYFNPRTPRGVRRQERTVYLVYPAISIHAPREGCDKRAVCLHSLAPISIHAPREGCDRKAFKSISKAKHFNPRTPRGVRQGPSGRCSRDSDNFNPRTPRGVRPRPPPSLCHSQSISIHAPREGCDHGKFEAYAYINDFNPRTPRGVRHMLRGGGTGPHGFQSTHPARGATAYTMLSDSLTRISIHAPREGCDFFALPLSHSAQDFNPRTPRGVRLSDLCGISSDQINFNPRTPRGVRRCFICRVQQQKRFQSTHPARGATPPLGSKRRWKAISIHAPREGCDLTQDKIASLQSEFQSTHPARGATSPVCETGGRQEFQSTHPARGATFFSVPVPCLVEFQSTHPARGATEALEKCHIGVVISIHAPREGCDPRMGGTHVGVV